MKHCKKEYIIMENKEKFKYIARDKCDNLYAYDIEPKN